MVHRFATTAALVLLFHPIGTGLASAQTPEREPAVVELPASTRAMGLGHAYQVGAADPDALFYNPALLGRGGGVRAGLHAFGDEALGFTLSAALDFFGGAIGVGLQGLEFGSDGPGVRDGGLDPILRDGTESVGELAASAGYGRSIFGFDVGVAGKIVTQRFASFRQASAAADVGVARRVGRVTIGLAAQNLGPDRELIAGTEVQQPMRGTLSAGGYGWQLGPLDVGAAAAVSLRDDEEIVGGGGIEVAYWPVIGRTFVVRVGGRHVPEGDALPVTFGASYWGDSLVLEYAFQQMDELEDVHRVTVGWR